MTRLSIYSVALGIFCLATVLTLTSITTTHWVTYTVQSENTNTTFSHHLGLHHSCTSTNDPKCRPFPDVADCRGSERNFCSLWRTSGFLMSFATIIELATAVSFLVVMAGGKYQREQGWRVIVGLLAADALVEFTGMGIVAYLFDHDDAFAVPGWTLDYSWSLCVASASISALLALGFTASAYILPPEDDYEYLDNPVDDV